MYTKDKTAVKDRREMLRVKLKSLAVEAKFIRHEEKRTWGEFREELHAHRIKVVRVEARHTGLAYGFIRGRTFEQMESNTTPETYVIPDWERVRKMLKKYGPSGMQEPEIMAVKSR